MWTFYSLMHFFLQKTLQLTTFYNVTVSGKSKLVMLALRNSSPKQNFKQNLNHGYASALFEKSHNHLN